MGTTPNVSAINPHSSPNPCFLRLTGSWDEKAPNDLPVIHKGACVDEETAAGTPAAIVTTSAWKSVIVVFATFSIASQKLGNDKPITSMNLPVIKKKAPFAETRTGSSSKLRKKKQFSSP